MKAMSLRWGWPSGWVQVRCTVPRLLGDGVGENVRNRVRRRVNLVRVGVRDLDAKLLLNRHDDLDRVQAVQAQVVRKVGVLGDLINEAREGWVSFGWDAGLLRCVDGGTRPLYMRCLWTT